MFTQQLSAQQHLYIRDRYGNPIKSMCIVNIKTKATKTVKSVFLIRSQITEQGEIIARGNLSTIYDIFVTGKGYQKTSVSQNIYDGMVITLYRDPAYIDTGEIARRAREDAEQEFKRQLEAIMAENRHIQDSLNKALVVEIALKKRAEESLRRTQDSLVVAKTFAAEQTQKVKNLEQKQAASDSTVQDMVADMHIMKAQLNGLTSPKNKKKFAKVKSKPEPQPKPQPAIPATQTIDTPQAASALAAKPAQKPLCIFYDIKQWVDDDVSASKSREWKTLVGKIIVTNPALFVDGKLTMYVSIYDNDNQRFVPESSSNKVSKFDKNKLEVTLATKQSEPTKYDFRFNVRNDYNYYVEHTELTRGRSYTIKMYDINGVELLGSVYSFTFPK